MQSIALIFNSNLSCILMKKTNENPQQWTCPVMDVPSNKDPMLFVYEAAKEAFGTSAIKTQMWFLKTEKCVGNSYIDIDHDFYIGAGIQNTDSIIKIDSEYEWVPFVTIRRHAISLAQKSLVGYIDESVYLFSYLSNLHDNT